MCGRYSLHQAPYVVRRRLQAANMPANAVPEEDQVRLSYNFAPGYYGMVYRADVPDTGNGTYNQQDEVTETPHEQSGDGETPVSVEQSSKNVDKEPHYKLQAMKWGLIPFWTKRNPDFGSMIKTINCRDDSLIEDRGMWKTMKKKKRCIVVCQGFYEWLKKNNGRDRIPHYIKRKDDQLLCFAGLWDCVQYEGSNEKLYTYTIITTSANSQIKFLHDRMPVIFEAGSEAMRTWLDPSLSEWSKSLQSLLRPYEGELEIYQVSKDVGKVGNNSPTFIVPLDSADNKNNIANFFSSQKKATTDSEVKRETIKVEEDVKQEGLEVKHDPEEERQTISKSTAEDNAPMPVEAKGIKRESEDDRSESKSNPGPIAKQAKIMPNKSTSGPKRRSRDATSNGTTPADASSKSQGTPKITKFFGK